MLHTCSSLTTYQLELAESLQVNDGDGTGGSLDLGLGQGDELWVSDRPHFVSTSSEPAHLVDVDGG